MPKATDTQVIETPEELTLEEFCVRASLADKRTELIGAFHYQEKNAGRFKDLESAYQRRLQEFATKPA